jgi:ribosomal protein L7Ae-like RNA K-turn-binding protein
MDASDNTKKRFDDMCSFRNVPIYFYASKEELGKAIGKEMRSSAAVLNKGLAEKIIGQLESQK